MMKNATYTDISRKWQNLPLNHLESLVLSSSEMTSNALDQANRKVSTQNVSLLDLAYEREMRSAHGLSDNAALTDENKAYIVSSVMRKPVLLKNDATINNCLDESSNGNTSSTSLRVSLNVESDISRIQSLSCKSHKRYLLLRERYQEEERKIRQLERSLAYQQRIKSKTEIDIQSLLSSTSTGSKTNGTEVAKEEIRSDSLTQALLEADRVIAQLNRKLSELINFHKNESKNELDMTKSVAQLLRTEVVTMKLTYAQSKRTAEHNFYDSWKLFVHHGSTSMMNHLISRQYGIDANLRQKGALNKLYGPAASKRKIADLSKLTFCRRISHVVTINAHLFYPVYCLRFDRTGRYFVTGSDDNIVKLFRIGTSGFENERRKDLSSIQDIFSFQRGAVLVCTLRGHASVITDIDISSDNSFVATASEDGDVRVWGMVNGCPVAILRGHDGGANMVSILISRHNLLST